MVSFQLTELRVKYRQQFLPYSKAGCIEDDIFLDSKCQKSRDGSGGTFIRSTIKISIGAMNNIIDDLMVILIGHEAS